VRVVGLLVVQALGALPGGDGVGGGGLVGVDGDFRCCEDAVAERVVEVLVRVDHADDLAGQGAHLVRDRRRGPLGCVGVDHQQPELAADDADVDVEPAVPGHPAAVGHLDEACVNSDLTHAPHGTASR
jgi:hypothetical protein